MPPSTQPTHHLVPLHSDPACTACLEVLVPQAALCPADYLPGGPRSGSVSNVASVDRPGEPSPSAKGSPGRCSSCKPALPTSSIRGSCPCQGSSAPRPSSAVTPCSEYHHSPGCSSKPCQRCQKPATPATSHQRFPSDARQSSPTRTSPSSTAVQTIPPVAGASARTAASSSRRRQSCFADLQAAGHGCTCFLPARWSPSLQTSLSQISRRPLHPSSEHFRSPPRRHFRSPRNALDPCIAASARLHSSIAISHFG